MKTLQLTNLNSTVIFVYGTLMKGQRNHTHFLSDAEFVGDGCISGFDMYDLGSFPGIIPGNGCVKGEIYRVPDSSIPAIDRLEGEGSLYIKTSVTVHDESGNKLPAYVYVYNHSVSGCRQIFGKYGDED